MSCAPRSRAFILAETRRNSISVQFNAYQHRPHGTSRDMGIPIGENHREWNRVEHYRRRLRNWLTIWKIASPDTCVVADISVTRLPCGWASKQSLHRSLTVWISLYSKWQGMFDSLEIPKNFDFCVNYVTLPTQLINEIIFSSDKQAVLQRWNHSSKHLRMSISLQVATYLWNSASYGKYSIGSFMVSDTPYIVAVRIFP